MCYQSQLGGDRGEPSWVERQATVAIELDPEHARGAVAVDSRLAELESVGASLCALLGLNASWCEG